MSLCPCGRPAKLSGRVSVCAVCLRRQRHLRAVETRIDRQFKLARLAQRQLRRAA